MNPAEICTRIQTKNSKLQKGIRKERKAKQMIGKLRISRDKMKENGP